MKLSRSSIKTIMTNNAASSTGLRLEYWRKSLGFFANAPMLGNGTGSTKQLFERDAIGQSGASADVIGNPHNQTLNVAVQWGLLGCVCSMPCGFATSCYSAGRASPRGSACLSLCKIS